MNSKRLVTLAIGGVLCATAGCSLDVPDLNDPGLDTLESSPDASKIGAAATGLLIGNRGNVAAPNGYIVQLGIEGREAYNFDPTDPRYVSEMIIGTLKASSPFGGNFWGGPYNNIRLGNTILHALDKLPTGQLTEGDKAAVRGFTHTINALDLLEVINTHDTNGAVVDTDQPIVLPPAVQPLGAIVDKATTLAKIGELLDTGATELNMAVAGLADPSSATFPFLLSSGYAGFDTPATFRTFNRAIRARVAVYAKDYATAKTALAESFLVDTDMPVPIDFKLGVYQVYSTATGDTPSGLISPTIYAHPSLEAAAQKSASGTVDLRFTSKITPASTPGGVSGTALKSSLKFGGLYNTPSSPVPIIRNEELILIKAEALWFGTPQDKAGAIAELNIVRTEVGGLTALGVPPSDTAFLDELLYERRFSLLFEGHRWIDVRRFNRVTTDIPPDDPKYKLNVRYPIPQPECDGRKDEPACKLGTLLCGNGIVDPGEQCDDHNAVDTDACSNACKLN